ncbi:MAG: DNA-binding NarL/FixJ family response regulator [Flavobacteriales bacterium]|jgi:DNA-binding NarL/FixJ family response regulator
MNSISGSGELILVVDDSPETLGMLNDALDKSGMTILVALDGKQALNIANKMMPDIILLDALMPYMDGFETCIELKKNVRLEKIPVIFMTGLSDTDSIVKGFEAGGVDYLTKPINPIELIARMKVHLTNSRLTVDTENALETAGQNVFTVDQGGNILWTTPFVRNFLSQLHETDALAQADFKDSIAQWLKRSPSEGNKIKLKSGTDIAFITLSKHDNALLRLIDENQMDENDILHAAFPITKREAEVLSWIAKGKTNREIALILDMSPRTVNKHLEQIYKKIGVDNRTSAAGMALDKLQIKKGF